MSDDSKRGRNPNYLWSHGCQYCLLPRNISMCTYRHIYFTIHKRWRYLCWCFSMGTWGAVLKTLGFPISLQCPLKSVFFSFCLKHSLCLHGHLTERELPGAAASHFSYNLVRSSWHHTERIQRPLFSQVCQLFIGHCKLWVPSLHPQGDVNRLKMCLWAIWQYGLQSCWAFRPNCIQVHIPSTRSISPVPNPGSPG